MLIKLRQHGTGETLYIRIDAIDYFVEDEGGFTVIYMFRWIVSVDISAQDLEKMMSDWC